jgi:cytochrome c-type biogenesis protein CcmH
MTGRPWGLILLATLLAVPATLLGQAGGPTAPPMEPLTFETDEQEVRYQRLVRELRCTVCQNQNLIESNAPLANDLRRQISIMVKDGAETDEIIDYMVSRYGDFVLFRPPKNATTYLLWYGPGAMLILGLAALGFILWRRRTQHAAASPLSQEEQERLRRILGEDEGSRT